MHKDENLLIEEKYLVIEQSSKSWNTHHSSSETRGRSLVCNCLGKTEFSIELAPIHRTCKFSADMRSAVGCGRRVQACPQTIYYYGVTSRNIRRILCHAAGLMMH